MLSIRLLGELELELDGESLELPRSRRARAVLAWLALHPGLHPRSRLAARFWPDVLDSSARASLRSAIWALRSTLAPQADALVAGDRESVGLREDGLWVDVREFDRLVAEGRLADGVALCRGELLYELDDDWAFEARDEHSDRLSAALEVLASGAESSSDHRAAVEWTRRRVALDPLDEEAARALIRRLAGAGDVPAALGVYARLAERLRGELGIAPSGETRDSAQRLRAAAPAERVNAARPSPVNGPRQAGPLRLFGRDPELATLLQAWERARSGSGTAVMLLGEGGIGKTRLAEEVVDTAADAGARTSVCAAAELGSPPPFALWSELLADLVDQLAPLPDQPSWARELARIVPGIEPSLSASGAAPELERARLFEAVAELLDRATRDRPLVLVLEDVHLADRSSLDLVAYAGRRIARLPLLMVLTRRVLPARPEVDLALGTLRARSVLAAELRLAPLGAGPVRELASAVSGLSADAVESVVAVATGSPLLAVETAAALARGDDATAGLGGAVRAAVSRLGDAARRFIELAAAAGRDLERAEAAMLPLEDPSGAATEALGSGLLHARRGTIGFRHALLRAAVYEEIAEPLRAELHDALAHALRGRGGHSAVRRAAEVARHLRLAGRDELAVGQLTAAAADARAVAALPEAAEFLREAHEIEPQTPDLLVELAEVEAWQGLLRESDEAFARALERTPAADSGALVSAWLRRGRWLRGGVCHPRESRRSYRNALDVLDREPEADPLARAEALAGLAWAEAVAGDPGAVDALLRDAGELTGWQPGGDLLAHDVGVARGHALLRAGRFEESYGPLVAASAAASRAGRPDMAYSCLINAASAAACAGDFDRALDFADRCLPLVVPNGLLRLGVYVQSARVSALRSLGRLGEAGVACEAAAGVAERAGLDELDGLVHHDRGLLALAAGEPRRAARELALALDRRAPIGRPLTRLRRAEALARSGCPDEAEAELRSVALEPVSPSDFPDTLVATMTGVQGLIARARGDLGVAEQRLREAVEGWRRRASDTGDVGKEYTITLVDLGRPPISALVEPERELERLTAEIGELQIERDRAPEATLT